MSAEWFAPRSRFPRVIRARHLLLATLGLACNRGGTPEAGEVRLGPAPPPTPTCDGSATELAPGIRAERWTMADTPATPIADRCIDVVRIDLARYRARLATSARDGASRPATAWADDLGAAAVVNLGMFRDDGLPVALAVDARGPLTSKDNPRFGGFLAFDPVDATDPPAVVAGRTCAGFDLPALRRRYRTVVQGYRLLECDGDAIAWKDVKSYSAAAIGVDRADRLVMIHVRAPYTMGALSAALAQPALGLRGAIFVEGGPEASLVVRGPARSLERVGSFETSFLEADSNHRFWDLPNVIAVVARSPEPSADR